MRKMIGVAMYSSRNQALEWFITQSRDKGPRPRVAWQSLVAVRAYARQSLEIQSHGGSRCQLCFQLLNLHRSCSFYAIS
jgi:hypothetical protein